MDHLEAPGVITAALPHGVYRAELANGHSCIARSRKKDSAAVYSPGDAVRLEFSPADLSRARILGAVSGPAKMSQAGS